MLNATIWHVIDAIGRDIIDHQAANLDLLESLPYHLQITGKNARLQAKITLVDSVNSLPYIGVGNDADERSEDFVIGNSHCRLDSGQDGRLPERALMRSTQQRFRTSGTSLINPGCHPLGFASVDNRADIGRLIQRIADLKRSDPGKQGLEERLIHIL